MSERDEERDDFLRKFAEDIKNMPIDKLERELRECGVKFVPNPNYEKTAESDDERGK